MNSKALTIAICAIFIVPPLFAAEPRAEVPAKSKLHKLHVEHVDFGNTPRLDVPYRFLSERAHEAFSAGKLKEAEGLYRSALKDAVERKAGHEQQVMLTVNLAAVLRDEKKYEESEKLFGSAIENARLHLKKRQGVLDYVGSQYAGLLRKQGKELQAQLAEDGAKVGFETKPLTANASGAAFKTGIFDGPFPTTRKNQKQQSSGPKYVDYTLTIEPLSNDDIDWYHRDPTGVDPRNSVSRITAELDFTIESQISPIHVKVRTKPDTGVWPQGVRYVETWNHPSWREPYVRTHSRPAPCAIEPTTYRAKIPFYNRGVSSRTRWNGPSGKNFNTTSQGFFIRVE